MLGRRTKRQEAPESQDRWLITYADLITLLLIFFVIMYAMSKVDMQKYKVLAQSLQLEFRKSDTVLPEGSSVIGPSDQGKGKDHSEEAVDPHKVNPPTEKELAQVIDQRSEKELLDLLAVIQRYVDDNSLQAHVSARNTDRGIAITLNDLFLFDLGKADLKPAALPILKKLGSLFPKLHSKVSIEGHTDNVPVAKDSQYQDNWGLSAARSLSVLRYFVDKVEVPESKFIITSFADTKPVAPNTTEANRQKNRRVEIVVLREEPGS